jgi:aminopeptidase YwaD
MDKYRAVHGRRRTTVTSVFAGMLLVVLMQASILGLACGSSPSGVTTASAAVTRTSIATSATSTSLSIAASTSLVSTTTVAPLTTATTSLETTTTELITRAPLPFNATQAMKHIGVLADGIGVRPGGSSAEYEAVEYVTRYLTGLGYDPIVSEVPLPNGRTSHNVTIVKEGVSPLTVLVGAHLDTKSSTPGGNDDASGVATVLELVRDVAKADLTPTIIFVLFGTEEIIDADASHHHYGSRAYVESMTPRERGVLVAMISLDMIGFGRAFYARAMERGPLELRDMLVRHARETGLDLSYLKDMGPTGWSDHEPFELAGYPAVWLQWHQDPQYHKAGDTYEHCEEGPLQTTGRFVLDFLSRLDQPTLEQLLLAVRQ